MSHCTLVEILQARALQQPKLLAYRFLINGEEEGPGLNYKELTLKARAIAALLQNYLKMGEHVLLLYSPCLDFVPAFFGCLFAGVVAVPMYPPGNRRRLTRLNAIVTDSQAALVLTTTKTLDNIKTWLDQQNELNRLPVLTTDDIPCGMAHTWQGPPINKKTLAILQYTSGSTTMPKGVMLSHENVLHNSAYIDLGFRHTPQSVSVTWLPTFHDMGLIDGVIQPMYKGFPCFMMAPVSFIQRPLRWLKAISKYKATHSGGPNFAYELCIKSIQKAPPPELDLSSWSVAYNGAEPIRAQTIKNFARLFAPFGFCLEAFYPSYGLAEATLKVTGGFRKKGPVFCRLSADAIKQNKIIPAAAKEKDSRTFVGCGDYRAGMKVVIVHPQLLTRCSTNEVGEIWVSGPSIARGYWRKPGETKQTFRAYLADTGEGPFLRTGDTGFIRNGELFVTGRLKDLIIIRGNNYYPQDIEFTVEQCHWSLRPGCGAVFSVEVANEEQLVIVQELKRGDKVNQTEVIAAIRQAVNEVHELQVYAVVLVKQGSIPKTSSGKVRRHKCRQDFLAGTLNQLAAWRCNLFLEQETNPSLVKPSFESIKKIEAWLISQLAARLNVNINDIDPGCPLTRYGVDSIAAIQLVYDIETVTGIGLPMVNFLQGHSISQLSSTIFNQVDKEAGTREGKLFPTNEECTEFPLSYGQRALWFLHQLEPESPAYNIMFAARICSTLDIPSLVRTWQTLVNRHPALRTVFKNRNGEPYQQVKEQVEPFFRVEDSSTWSQAQLNKQLLEEGYRPFNLEKGPLLRVKLYKRSAREYILFVGVHHIVVDLWSLAVLIREWGALYSMEKSSISATLDPLPLQYADFVRLQKEMLNGPTGEQLGVYWQKQLADELPALHLPFDCPPPPLQTYRGAALGLKLSQELTQKLKEMARHYQTTLYTVLLTVFFVLLYRHTGQETILVGSPTAGRSRVEMSNLVGYFVNLMVLRADLPGNPTFHLFLNQVRHTLLAALQHQDYPFSLLVEQLQPKRDPKRSPLIQAMFVMQKTHLMDDRGLALFAMGEEGARLDLGDFSLQSIPLEQRIAQFDLTLTTAEIDMRLAAWLQYNTDLFTAARMKRMLEHYRILLKGIADNPQQRISELPLLTELERQQLVIEWNNTEEDYPRDTCIHQLFEARVQHSPEATALFFENTCLTYRELNRRANCVAHYLGQQGVGPEVAAGICMERSLEMVLGILGILKAGGAYVPLDPAYPKERLRFILEDARVPVLLTQEHLLKRLPGHKAHPVCLDADWEKISQQDKTNPVTTLTANHLAYVIYTSGSTGIPRGVGIEHRNTVALLCWAKKVFASELRGGILASTSICFDLSVFELFVPLCWGGKVIMVENLLQLPTTSGSTGITLINTVPSVMAELLRIGGIPSSVATVNLAGEPLREQLVKQLYQQGSLQKVFDLYGPSEATTYSTYGLRGESGPETIGRPITNTRVYLLNSGLQPVPIGVAGEIHISGAGVARGYLNNPELTAAKFVLAHSSWLIADRKDWKVMKRAVKFPMSFELSAISYIYKTGDLARYLGDGNLEFLGRKDHQVKLRGYRIELGEIETVLMQQPEVGEAVVTMQEDETKNRYLTAYVTCKTEKKPDMVELRKFLQDKLSGYMVPTVFMVLEGLPLTANGKVDRGALPAPDKESVVRWEAYVGPRTAVEEILTGMWSELLGVQQVGIYDHFFQLGGHSLLATQLLSRVRDTFRVEIPLHCFFETPTIASLGERIQSKQGMKRDMDIACLERVPRDTPLPLSFAQQRLWFLDRLQPDSAAYNMPVKIGFTGSLQASVLEQSLNEIIRRHEVLRTAIAAKDGQPVQVISPLLVLRLAVVDFSELSGPEKEARTRGLLFEEARRPFELDKAPLLRAILMVSSHDEYLLFLNMHHIISDGWSMGIFLRQLSSVYESFSKGEPSPLPELAVQYADFAHWQRKWLKGEVLATQLSFWKEHLTDVPVLSLPTDHPPTALRTFRGATHTLLFSPHLSDELKALSRRERVTLFMTLLATFKTLLYRYSGQTDIVVGTPIANRNRLEIEELMGFFANTLVLRTGLSGNPRFRELLPRVRQVALAAYAHQDLPFEKLVEELQPERSFNRTPLFQVMFILQDAPLTVPGLWNFASGVEEIDTKTSKFDLLLSVMETEGGIMASLQYDTDLFAAGTIKRMLAHYRVLLESIIAQPDRRISELPLLTELERQRQVEQWNNTGVDYPQDKCIHQLFEARTEQTPGAAAVVFENACLTYRELNHRANRLARYLCQHGVGPETAVGILMERSLEMVVGLLGILKAGGAYVPLDPGYPGEGLQFILEDARVPVVLTQERWAKELPGHRTHVICLDTDGENIARQSKENPDINLALENSIYITYPAGKRILVTRKGMLGRLQRQQETFPLSGSDVLLYHTSLLVNIAVPEIFWSLLYGGCLAAVNEDKQNYPAYLLDRLVRHQISVAWFFPSTLYSLVISINHGTMPLKALRWVFCSGEPLPGKVVNAFFKHIHCDLYYLYGFPGVPAEITLKKCEPGEIWDTLPIGFPYQVAVYILDKHLHPVPQGAVGEIYIAADGVACFSMKDPQEAALRFLPNPFTGRDGDRLFKTGDSGYYTNNGNIKLIPSPSRAEIAGFPVELEEIETALLSLPLIDECTVMVRESETFTRELVAYVVSSMPLSSGRLQANLRTILPARLVPSVYVHLSALPLTASGDIDKNFLSHLEVIDDNLVRRWEKRIGSLSKVSQAAVVVREQVKHTPPLHLSEVFPDWGTKEVNEIDEQTEYRAEQQDGETCTMAFSDGGPLIIGADAPKTLTAALVRTAFTHKNKGIIYIDNDGSETFLAYESLLTNARCMLSGLKQAHLNPGDKVILQIEMLPDYFTVFWACILGGIVPVTVAIADSYEEKNSVVNKLYHIWELLEHPPVVAGDDITGAVSKMKQFLPMQDLEVLSVGELRSDTVSENFHQSQPGDIAFFQLTSGSTGAPKCIQEAHHCIISHIHGSKQFNGYTPEDVSLNWLPVDHVVPLLTYHIKDVYSGCQQIHVNTAAILADPLKWLDLLEKYNVTHSWSPNFGFKLISEYLTRSPEKKWDLCSVKFFMNAGEQVTLPIISEFLRLVSPFNAAPQTMQPAFGMAEVCTCMTYQNHFNFERGIHRFERSSLSGKLKKTGNDSTDTVTFVDLGPPIPGVQIRIVDKKNQLLPEGVIGRLQIKGDVVTPGYFNNPAANRDAFVGNGWFDSGDLGFILDKRLVLTGRGKDIIIINGVNYCCYEIEDVVKEIPDVEPLHVGACAVHDPSTGSEGLAIFFAPLTDHIDEKIKLIKTIRNRVTEKMGINPNDVVPVEKKDFPRTTSGKIQRSQLKKMLETGYFKKILKEIDLRLENNHTLPAWFYRKTWRAKKPVTIHKQALSGQYLVFLDPMGLGTCLIEELQRLNQPCVSVEMGAKFTKLSENHFCIDPQCPQHYRQLLNSLSKSNFQVNQVLHLWTYDQFTASIDNREDLEQSQYRGVYSLLYLSKALMQENTQQHPVRLYVISNYSQPIPPYNKIAYEKSTVIGLIKTIPREIPWLSPFHVDLTNDKTTVNAARIVGEIQIVDKDDEVAYRNGKRLVARLEKIDLRQEENRGIPIKHGGMYLVSGGLGGIGVEIARYLLKHYQLRLLLIGRTGLPGISTPSTSKENNPVTREKIKAYRTLEKIGGEIMYEAVDILDSDRLKQVVNRAKSLWKCPLDGIIHLAGSLQEGSLAEESHASFVDKICTKVFGTWSLAQLLQHQPGTLFISFSSVNSYFGGAMTGAYTASNCFLDCFSFYQRYKRSLRSYCFNWSKWDNVGMNLSYGSKDILRAGGFQEISISQGIHSFLAGLSYDQEQLFIGLNGHNSHLRRHIVQQSYPIRKLSAYFVSQEGSGAVAKLHEAEVGDRFGTQSTCEFIQIPEMPLTANGEVDRAALSRFVSLKPGARVPYIKPGNKCEKILAAIWQEVLRIDRIGINDHFFELGGHSIQATQVHLKIREVFNRDLTVLDLFKYPTIRSLARYLEKEPKQESSFRASLNRAKTRTRLTGQQRKRRQLHRESKG